MKRNILAIGSACLLATCMAAPAYANNLVLTLTRTNLTNVVDAAGTWQIEVGTVARGAVAAGQYQVERRVSTGGSTAQNTASVRYTFFLAQNRNLAPETVVVEGSHSFNSGAFLGSVSAASTKYAFLRDADATVASVPAGGVYSMTLNWPGLYGFALP